MKLSLLPKLLLLFILIHSFENSYTQDFTSIKPSLSTSPSSTLNCSSNSDPYACNFIKNDQFNNNPTNTTNPFPFGQVNDWVETHGSPALTNFMTPLGTPPIGIAGYSSMYSWYSINGTEGEGIAQKISPLQQGKFYAMSFFKKLAGASLESMGKFYIVLLHCEDYPTIHNYPSYSIPSIPKNSQVIYCENGVSNTDWQQIFNCFRAGDNYDLVWIFPVQDLETGSFTGLSGVDFSGLEIISTTGFSAGPTPLPTYANPIVNIGPTSPNCGLRNAVFTWYGPNEQVINADPSQKITVDASDSLQIGEWTLRMTVPANGGRNNPCKQTCNISASIQVPMARKPWASPIRCDLVSSPNCNLIQNSTFTRVCGPLVSASNASIDPFYMNCIDNWDYAFGTPQLNAYFNPLDANYNTASMWASGGNTEGIATGIPKLVIGRKYMLSFYRAATPNLGSTTPDLELFNIYLTNCSDYNSMELEPHLMQIPQHAQQIYCETHITNSGLRRVSICFTAESDYNVVWFFPRQWNIPAHQWWLGIAQPELLDVTEFSAGTTPSNPSNCNITLGPTVPNCGPTGATYAWIGPNGGTPIPANPAQQITINASLPQNVGIWKLRMTIPNTVTTNNTCSNTCNIVEASVEVELCTPPGPPVITTASYFEYGGCSPAPPPNAPIIPNTQNQFCFFWECGGTAYFKSSINNGNNQWYVNDVLVPSLQNYSTITGWTDIPSPDQLRLRAYNNAVYFKVQVKNTTYGFTQLSSPTYIYFAPTISVPSAPYGYGGQYKANFTKTFDFSMINHGPNAVYNWQFPNTCSPISQTSKNPTVTFGPNVDETYNAYLTATLTVTNSFCNMVTPIRFYYSPSASRSVNETEINSIENSLNTFDIYPNPTRNQLNIRLKDAKGYRIEIYNTLQVKLKSIQITNNKNASVNVSDLARGIYVCKIIDKNGITSRTFIIN